MSEPYDSIEAEYGASAVLAWAKTGRFFSVSTDADGWRIDQYGTNNSGRPVFVRVVSRPRTFRGARRSAAQRNYREFY